VAGVIGRTATRVRSGVNKHKGNVEAVVSELAVPVHAGEDLGLRKDWETKCLAAVRKEGSFYIFTSLWFQYPFPCLHPSRARGLSSLGLTPVSRLQ